MANKNEVTISLEEYKELLLKDKPNNKDKMLLERFKELLFESIEYYKNWDGIVAVQIKHSNKFEEELLTTIKVVDKELYKEMVKFACDKKQKKDNENAKMEKARAIKDIDTN